MRRVTALLLAATIAGCGSRDHGAPKPQAQASPASAVVAAPVALGQVTAVLDELPGDEPGARTLHVSFAVTPTAALPADADVAARAVCGVGPRRFVDEMGTYNAGVAHLPIGEAHDLEVGLFVGGRLPAPTSCEVTLRYAPDHSSAANRVVLATYCLVGANLAAGPCDPPPPAPKVAAGATPVAVDEVAVGFTSRTGTGAGDGHYVKVALVATPRQRLAATTEVLANVRCRAGHEILADSYPFWLGPFDHEAGEASPLETDLFLLAPLADAPELCELSLTLADATGGAPRPLATYCATAAAVAPGSCADLPRGAPLDRSLPVTIVAPTLRFVAGQDGAYDLIVDFRAHANRALVRDDFIDSVVECGRGQAAQHTEPSNETIAGLAVGDDKPIRSTNQLLGLQAIERPRHDCRVTFTLHDGTGAPQVLLRACQRGADEALRPCPR